MALSQKNRHAVLTTPLGQDVLVLQRLEAQEGLSELFEFSIDALSEKPALDFDPAIGRNCSVKVASFGSVERHFTGILADADWNGVQDGLYVYRLVLRPWLWLLTHTTDCRLWLETSVKDIIVEVFSKAGFTDYELRLTGSYDPIEFCVQYRETHFAFVSRLMEEFGIYYFFTHEADKHTLVLADNPSAHRPVAGGAKLDMIPLGGAVVRDREHIVHLTSERRFRSGKFTVNDYDFEAPNKKLVADREAGKSYQHGALEVYDYPGRYTDRGKGEGFAKIRLEAEQALDNRRIAQGEAVSIYPGGKFKLDQHHAGSENIEYLVVRSSHTVMAESYRSGGGGGQSRAYYGNYVLAPLSQPFRAPIVTQKPLVHGVQTAKVIGDGGEEITVDKYGRIKVQFHWDREKKGSCWIRVAEQWSGKNWGSVFHPRHGQEVVIDFLEGDPDRPLCVGTVYNGDNMVPYDLPANKTIGGHKTNSTVGGGGYNEFIYEDKKGQEKIRMHAEKDHDVTVRNKETWKIGEIFMPPKGSASRDTTILNGDDKLTVASGDQNVTIAQDRKMQVGMNHDETIGMNQTITVGMNQSSTIGMSESSTVGMTRSATIGVSDTVTAGATITLTATAAISLVCGPSTLTLSPAGIVMTGPIINMTGMANISGIAPTVLFQGAGAGIIPYPGMTLALT